MAWTVVITGVSRGLGAALCGQLCERGDRVIGIGRRFTDQQQELARREPDRVVLRRADLAEPTGLPDADEFRGWLRGGVAGPVALVHNAAVVEPIGAVGGLPAEEVARAVAINLTAPMVLTNAFLAAVAGAPATVLFLSSGAAHRLIEGWAVYSATKRGGETFFDAVAAQEPRVRVATANPGVMDTDMQARIREAAAAPVWFPQRDRFVALHAEGRLPAPEQVAHDLIAEHLTSRA